LEDAAADQMEQLNASAGSALGMLPVWMQWWPKMWNTAN
jgi:hypothetical protein